MATIYDLDALNKQVEILRDALAQYANPDNWKEQIDDPFFMSPGDGDDVQDVFFIQSTPGKNGYELAQAALEKADKLIHKDLWSENT